MACHFHGSVFCHLLAWKLLSMGALSPRRRRCSSALQKVYRVLAAAFFEGVLLWLAVQSDPLPAPLFAHFFWRNRKSGSAKQRLQCHCNRGSPVNPDKRADRVCGAELPLSGANRKKIPSGRRPEGIVFISLLFFCCRSRRQSGTRPAARLKFRSSAAV